MYRRHLIPIVLLLALCSVVRADTPRPADIPEFEEDWYVLKLQDQRAGYAHSVLKRVGDEMHSTLFMRIEMARGDTNVKVDVEQKYRETIEGRPLALQSKMQLGAMPVTTTGVVEDGKITLTNEQGGMKQSNTYDFDPEIKFGWGTLLAQREHGYEKGTKFTIKTYEPTVRVDGPVDVEIVSHGRETLDILGEKQSLIRLTSTTKMPMPGGSGAALDIATEMYVDEEGSMVTTTMDMGMMKVKMFRASRDEALKKGEPPELFLNTLVPVAKRVPKDAKAVVYRFRLPEDGAFKMPDLPETAMQQVKRISDHEAEVRVERLDWSGIRSLKDQPGSDLAMKDYLGASTVVDINDRRIQRLAKRATRDADTPAERADTLRRFVTDYVRDKHLGVGFATATEVCRNREGDCSEHAVLLAALARATGLPARGVSGIVEVPAGAFAPETGSAFGYHMWTQVYIDGQWVDIDAALRQTDCDATHIALAIMPLNDGAMLEGVMPLLSLIGRLEVDVVRVEQ